jgi:single-strand DNA-binding protein
MNVLTVTGRVGRDAELRTTPGGSTVLNFSLVNDVGYGDRKQTQWISCALWGDRGAKLADYITKGKQLAVSGEVTVRAYSTREGEPAAELVLNVRELTLLGGREDRAGEDARDEPRQGAGGASREDYARASGGRATQRDAFGGGSRRPHERDNPPAADFDDDIPF